MSHRVNDSKRFELYAHVTDSLSANLEALFDNDTCSRKLSPGLLYDIYKPHKSTAVSKKIVNDKHLVTLAEIFFRYHYVICNALCVGLYLSNEHFAVKIFAESFLCKK